MEVPYWNNTAPRRRVPTGASAVTGVVNAVGASPSPHLPQPDAWAIGLVLVDKPHACPFQHEPYDETTD